MTRTDFTLMLDEVLNEFDCKIDGIFLMMEQKVIFMMIK